MNYNSQTDLDEKSQRNKRIMLDHYDAVSFKADDLKNQLDQAIKVNSYMGKESVNKEGALQRMKAWKDKQIHVAQETIDNIQHGKSRLNEEEEICVNELKANLKDIRASYELKKSETEAYKEKLLKQTAELLELQSEHDKALREVAFTWDHIKQVTTSK